MRDVGTGCWLENEFVGAFMYCDDIFLLSASRAGLQSLMTTCEKFASQNNLTFSTNIDPKKSKTKCMIFNKSPAKRVGVPEIILNNKPLPWVPQLNHLGHIFECENNLSNDTSSINCKFIGKVNTIKQGFHFANPDVKVTLYDKYAASFYGSNLWNLFCHETEKVYSAYNISIRQAFNLPFATHRYLIQYLIDHPHIKIQFCSRFIKFVSNNDACKKPIIRLISALNKSDNRTVYCSNIWNISKECSVDQDMITSSIVKSNMQYFKIPSGEEWRPDLLLNIIFTKLGLFSVDNFDVEELDDILEFLCTS